MGRAAEGRAGMKPFADYESALTDYLLGCLAPASGVRYVAFWLCHYQHPPGEEHIRYLWDDNTTETWIKDYRRTETDCLIVEHRPKDCRKDVLARLEAAYMKAAAEALPKPRPVFGSAKGKLIMADDFNEPLEDFKEYM
jgi:hypothetical protein